MATFADDVGSIRQARASDLDAVRRIVRQAYEIYLMRMDRPPGPMLDDYAARLAEETLFVMESAGSVAGILVLLLQPGHLLLDNVAVDPAFQGRGLGRRLIAFAEHQARQRGLLEVRLYTNAVMTENVGLYARLGFEETHRGEEAGYRRIYMRKKLAAQPG